MTDEERAELEEMRARENELRDHLESLENSLAARHGEQSSQEAEREAIQKEFQTLQDKASLHCTAKTFCCDRRHCPPEICKKAAAHAMPSSAFWVTSRGVAQSGSGKSSQALARSSPTQAMSAAHAATLEADASRIALHRSRESILATFHTEAQASSS